MWRECESVMEGGEGGEELFIGPLERRMDMGRAGSSPWREVLTRIPLAHLQLVRLIHNLCDRDGPNSAVKLSMMSQRERVGLMGANSAHNPTDVRRRRASSRAAPPAWRPRGEEQAESAASASEESPSEVCGWKRRSGGPSLVLMPFSTRSCHSSCQT